MEKILCAAIWYDDGKSRTNLPRNIQYGIVAAGVRHCNCFTILRALHPDLVYLPKAVQGFLTSENRFVDRVEAALIAKNAQQIEEPKFFGGLELDSSDLY